VSGRTGRERLRLPRLSASGDKVDYQYTTAEVIAIVQAACAANTKKACNDALAKLSTANEAGCPLPGTRANRG
jgi:hypothetical protein